MTIVAPGPKIPVVEYLRGFAALAVAWFHTTNNFPWGAVRYSGDLGSQGVTIFFVISGFVLPLSIWGRHGDAYTLRDFGAFMARRIVRIEPPYIASVVLTVLFAYLITVVPGFPSKLPTFTVAQLLSHIAYMPRLFDYDWVQAVYWTLAYEFVFYIVLGLIFPLLMKRPAIILIAVSAAMLAILNVMPGTFSGAVLLFAMGGAVFLRQRKLVSSAFMITVMILSGAWLAFSSPAAAVAGTVTALILWKAGQFHFIGIWHRSLIFLGAISYSLYITHLLVVNRIVQLGEEFFSGELQFLALSVLAISVSIACASLFHLLIERPFVTFSKNVGRPPTPRS